MDWNRLNPAVGRRWLLLIAGVTWMGVSVILAAFAYSWLRPLAPAAALPFAVGGAIVGFAAYRLGFVGLALRNIRRIRAMSERACVFAFMQWKSYLIIGVMSTSGALLRHSSFPKPYLAVVYLGMGACLFLSSLHYYPEFAAMP